MSVDYVKANLRRLKETYPNKLRIVASESEFDKLDDQGLMNSMSSGKGPEFFDNADKAIITRVEEALSSGKQVAISPAGPSQVLVAVGTGLFKDRHGYSSGSSVSGGGCFIATATYGSTLAPEVIFFRHFRDKTLLPSKIGATAVDLYYVMSPPLAALIAKSSFLRAATRKLLLEPLLRLLKMKFLLVLLSLSLTTSLCAACSGTATTSTTQGSNTSPEKASSQSLPNLFSKRFSGTINNRYQIEMSLRRNGTTLAGSYFYTKHRVDISIQGAIDDQGNLSINEFDSNGNQTGMFKGKLSPANTIDGVWSKPNGDKPMTFTLSEISNGSNPGNTIAGVASVGSSTQSTQSSDAAASASAMPAQSTGKLTEQEAIRSLNNYFASAPTKRMPIYVACRGLQGMPQRDEFIKAGLLECASDNFAYATANYRELARTEWPTRYDSLKRPYLDISLSQGIEVIAIQNMVGEGDSVAIGYTWRYRPSATLQGLIRGGANLDWFDNPVKPRSAKALFSRYTGVWKLVETDARF